MSSDRAADDKELYLRASDLGVTFPSGFAALKNLSFSLAKGEFVSIVGPSGCGKSTLLRLIAGLLAPSQGSLSLPVPNGTSTTPQEDRTGFVFQDHRLLPWRSAVDNIRLPMELHGVANTDQQELIGKSLQLVGLSVVDGRKTPRMLSGGMRMRVSLARALVTAPELLLLDEPFGALDDVLRQQLNEEVSRIWRQQRWTGVFVTHNVSEAVFLSQRILVMSPSPGRFTHEVQVPFEFPRSHKIRGDAAFARLAAQVSAHLRGEDTE